MKNVFSLKVWLIDQQIEYLLSEKENIDKRIDKLYEEREDMFVEWGELLKPIK